MANTRQSAKRARQSDQRATRNTMVRSAARTALKQAFDALQSKNLDQAKAAYQTAIRVLSKAATKGALPKTRAARKVSRLTQMVKKTLPEVFTNR